MVKSWGMGLILISIAFYVKDKKSILLLELNKHELFKSLLKGIHRLFLLTGYSSEILY